MKHIVFKDFSYAYKGKDKVLDTINLTIPQGSFTVITGPSGAGKTTLCLAIAGVVPHYFGGSLAGTVLVNEMQTLKVDMCQLAQRVGIVLEDYESQLVTMTVSEEVAFSLENQGMARQEIICRTQSVLGMVGLAGMEKAKVGNLSGGQKQRLAIASVLAAQPEILVLDEPSSALDPEGAESLYALLAELNAQNGMTVVVVEHDLSRVLAFAKQLVLLVDGRIVAEGTMESVMSFMGHTKTFVEGIPALWQLKLLLEAEAGYRLRDWRTEQDAVADLQEMFG